MLCKAHVVLHQLRSAYKYQYQLKEDNSKPRLLQPLSLEWNILRLRWIFAWLLSYTKLFAMHWLNKKDTFPIWFIITQEQHVILLRLVYAIWVCTTFVVNVSVVFVVELEKLAWRSHVANLKKDKMTSKCGKNSASKMHVWMAMYLRLCL